MKNILIFIFLSIPAMAHAEEWDDWTVADSVRQGALISLQLADLSQTRWAIKNPVINGHTGHETNPILGAHPSVGKADNLIGLGIVLHTAIAWALPPPTRQAWQYVFIVIEGNAVRSNKSIGIKIDL